MSISHTAAGTDTPEQLSVLDLVFLSRLRRLLGEHVLVQQRQHLCDRCHARLANNSFQAQRRHGLLEHVHVYRHVRNSLPEMVQSIASWRRVQK